MVLNQSPFLAVLQFPLVYFRSYMKLIVDWGPGKVPVQLFFFPMSFSTIHHSRDADTTGFYFPLYVLPVSISLINCRICFQRIVNTSSVNLNYFHKKNWFYSVLSAGQDTSDSADVHLAPPPDNKSPNPLPTNEQQSIPRTPSVAPAVAGRTSSESSAASLVIPFLHLMISLLLLLVKCMFISTL
jgi:hypothetical protein